MSNISVTYRFRASKQIFKHSKNRRSCYLYNGKELQEYTKNYDYGYRQLDPQLGRWHVIDALAENYMSHSPYAYVMNNPINYYDVMGLYSAMNALRDLWNSPNGGTWSAGDNSSTFFGSSEEAIDYMNGGGSGRSGNNGVIQYRSSGSRVGRFFRKVSAGLLSGKYY